MAGAPRAASRFGFCGFISITRTIARGVTAMVVGSSDLLGDRANPIERSPTTSLALPDKRQKISLPIRAFDLPGMLAGEEPLTSTLTHALGSAFSWIIANRELRKRSGRT